MAKPRTSHPASPYERPATPSEPGAPAAVKHQPDYQQQTTATNPTRSRHFDQLGSVAGPQIVVQPVVDRFGEEMHAGVTHHEVHAAGV